MKRMFQTIVFLYASVSITTGLHAQEINPYLQAIQPTSIVVNWKTSAIVSSPKVYYGTSENNLNQSITGDCKLITGVGYSNNYFYNTVKLNMLGSATKYYYRVISGGDSSKVYSFRTLPQPGYAPNTSGKLRFLILGDNQLKHSFRYDSLVLAAKRKMTERYGADFNDSVSFLLNLGDQVDNGSLDHYENLHFRKSRYLSSVLPIQTAVGNHETYVPEGIRTYYEHFVLDSMQYKGIYSGNEAYYSFQAGNVVFIYTNTDGTSTAQLNWAKRVIDTANADPKVKWIITIGHRPYRAEQYVSDVSPWLRDNLIPYCLKSPKYLLNVGAHHHLYARGQFNDAPAYHIISGGTAWDQYWENTSEETNAEDVQKTIANWAYQLIEIDMNLDKADVYTYSIGGKKIKTRTDDPAIIDTEIEWLDNTLIDSFHRYKHVPPPFTPNILHDFPDSLQLPLTIKATPFSSPDHELLNSTEFQVSASRDFSVIKQRSYRHFEDLYGHPPGEYESAISVNLNKDVDITRYTLPVNSVGNGWNYVRVRYRDRNQSWSTWSATDSFKVYNSVVFNPVISLDSSRYSAQRVRITFSDGSTDPNAWIGIYKKGQIPGTSTATVWQYTKAANGILNLTLPTGAAPGNYYAAYFGDGGYTQIAPQVAFYYGPIPVLSLPSYHFDLGATIPISYSNGPNLSKDWIGIYKIDQKPGSGSTAAKWVYTSGPSGRFNANGLAKGYYFTSYFLTDGYSEAAPRVYFSVGDSITSLSIAGTAPHQYYLGEYITTSWVDAPGLAKDWLGIYRDTTTVPNSDLISYTYIDGLSSGTKNIPLLAMPNTTGHYYLVLFTNDSYTEVSNRVHFEMISGTPLPLHLTAFSGEQEGATHLLHWSLASEESTEQYTLEHSTDGKNFNAICQVGFDASSKGQYSYLFENPRIGDNFYRLMITTGNSKTYSKIIRIRRAADREFESGQNIVTVYPNPAPSNSNSVIESPYPITQIDVLDINGQIIYQSKNIDDNKYSLFHQYLPAGNYILKIYSKQIYTAKLIVTQ